LNGRPDPEGVQHGSDANGSTEKPSGSEDRDLDAGTHEPDRQAGARDQSCHQPVAGTRPHACADVENAGQTVEEDARDHDPGTNWHGIEDRQEGQ